jgi:hypothetical protein
VKDKPINQLGGNILLCFAALFMPNIFLFFLFNNNKVMNNLHFSHFVVLAVVFSIISVCIFLVYRKISNSIEGAFVTLLISWIFFWLFEAILSIAVRRSASLGRVILLVCMAGGIAILLRIFHQYHSAIQKYRSAFLVLATTICVLFSYNFIPALHSEVLIGKANPPPTKKPYNIKTEFVVDHSLPSPDIYWFHMDEMVGFRAVEKYFGDAQDKLKAELIKRGFVLNESAELRAGYTQVAVPALLSPTFYDSYLRLQLAEAAHLLRNSRQRQLNERFRASGLIPKDVFTVSGDIASGFEMFRALKMKDYSTILISTNLVTINWGLIDRLYRANDEYPLSVHSNSVRVNVLEEINDLKYLLMTTTPFSLADNIITNWIEHLKKDWLTVPAYEGVVNQLTCQTLGIIEERRLYRRLYDALSVPSPKIIYMMNFLAHRPYNRVYETDKLENPYPDNFDAVDLLYLPQYKYAAKVMLLAIDMVLEKNPDAIIVLQGDHGIHHHLVQAYMVNKGFSDNQILSMNHSVISALRIPPQYGGLDKPVDPLNISRLLVNRFVGQNYELLDK